MPTLLQEQPKRQWLQFLGAEDDFAYWSEKYEAYMHTKKLREHFLGTVLCTNEADKYNLYAEFIQFLDKFGI